MSTTSPNGNPMTIMNLLKESIIRNDINRFIQVSKAKLYASGVVYINNVGYHTAYPTKKDIPSHGLKEKVKHFNAIYSDLFGSNITADEIDDSTLLSDMISQVEIIKNTKKEEKDAKKEAISQNFNNIKLIDLKAVSNIISNHIPVYNDDYIPGELNKLEEIPYQKFFKLLTPGLNNLTKLLIQIEGKGNRYIDCSDCNSFEKKYAGVFTREINKNYNKQLKKEILQFIAYLSNQSLEDYTFGYMNCKKFTKSSNKITAWEDPDLAKIYPIEKADDQGNWYIIQENIEKHKLEMCNIDKFFTSTVERFLKSQFNSIENNNISSFTNNPEQPTYNFFDIDAYNIKGKLLIERADDNILENHLKTNAEAHWSFLTHFNEIEKRTLSALVWALFEEKNRSPQSIILIGTGGDGKSAWSRSILNGLGEEAYYTLSSDVAKDKLKWGREARSCRVGYDPDCRVMNILDTEVYFKTTGGDVISYRGICENLRSAKVFNKYMICTNYDLLVPNTNAHRRRAVKFYLKDYPYEIAARLYEMGEDGKPLLDADGMKLPNNTYAGDYDAELEQQLPAYLTYCKYWYDKLCENHKDVKIDEEIRSLSVTIDSETDSLSTFVEEYLDIQLRNDDELWFCNKTDLNDCIDIFFGNDINQQKRDKINQYIKSRQNHIYINKMLTTKSKDWNQLLNFYNNNVTSKSVKIHVGFKLSELADSQLKIKRGIL